MPGWQLNDEDENVEQQLGEYLGCCFNIWMVFVMALRLFLRSPFIVFGAMVMAFTIDVKAALIFMVTIPLLSVVVF